jgi:hypothetical protein
VEHIQELFRDAILEPRTFLTCFVQKLLKRLAWYLRERVSMLNGVFRVETFSGEGTSIFADIPIGE